MTTDGISWVALLTLMVDGPDLPVHGVISSDPGADLSQQYFGWAVAGGQAPPVFAGFPAGLAAAPGEEPPAEPDPAEQETLVTRAWRAARRVRLERPASRTRSSW